MAKHVKYCILLNILVLSITARSQRIKELAIGDSLPNIMLRILNNEEKSIDMREFKGKAIIIDFWTTWCIPCVTSFPKIDSIQKKYGSKLQILPVTSEKRADVVFLFKQNEKLQNHKILVVVEDTILHKYLKHNTVPHYVWIDKNGIIQAITGQEEFKEANVQNFIEGKYANGITKKDEVSRRLDPTAPLFLGGNGIKVNDVKPLFQSSISKYIDGVPLATTFKPERITVMNASIRKLYQVAFSKGDWRYLYSDNVEVISDSPNKYIQPKVADRLRRNMWNSENMYCYEIIVPVADSAEKFRIMQEDLQRFFKLSAREEKRLIKCFALVRIGGKTKFITRGGVFRKEETLYQLKYSNVPINTLLFNLTKSLQYVNSHGILNETNYNGNIDLDINFSIGDLRAIREALKAWDLDIIEVERVSNVLILSDK
jgi:thiol-disulfide isomerase/thioredoxin